MLKMEQEEYAREEIEWNEITFQDNQDCLDLIEKVSLPASGGSGSSSLAGWLRLGVLILDFGILGL